MIAGLDQLEADVADGSLHRHHRRRGRPHRAGARPAGAARPRPRRQAARRPVPQRPGRHALPDVPARPRPDHRRSDRRPPGRAGRPRRGPPGRRDAGPYAPPARPARALRPPRPGPRPVPVPGRRAAAAVGRADGRVPVRLRRAGRLLARPRPGGGRRGPRLRARLGRQLHRRHGLARLRRRVRLHHRDDRRQPLPDRRGGHHLEHEGVLLRHPARRLLHRLVDHAAEEEPGHRRAGARQVRPADRQPDRA